MGDFAQRTAELQRRVGKGELTGKVEINLPYAAPQERGFWVSGPLAGVRIRKHPGGGGGYYLSRPLYARTPRHMHRLAGAALRTSLQAEMMHIMRDLCRDVYRLAPRKSGRLRGSGVPMVYDNGYLVNRGTALGG